MLPYTSQRLQGCSGQALGNCLVGFHVSKDTESQQILNQMLGCRPSPGGAFKYLTSFRGRLIIDGVVQLSSREIKLPIIAINLSQLEIKIQCTYCNIIAGMRYNVNMIMSWWYLSKLILLFSIFHCKHLRGLHAEMCLLVPPPLSGRSFGELTSMDISVQKYDE